jgi:hypothetical protein
MAGRIFALGVQYERPRDSYSPLEDSSSYSIFQAVHPKVLALRSTLFTDTTLIDFEKRQISFERRDSLGFTMGYYHYDELGEYLADRRAQATARTWYQNTMFAANSAAQKDKNDALKLQWEMPVQYPGWAQRVLGNDPPRLTITGSLHIKMAYEDVSKKESTVGQSATTAPGFNFEQVNQFNITGSVGRLINLNISANSEEGVSADDPLKKMKIDYQESKPGELEDEMVQQVTAGYTSFSMPGTQLSGYSESKDGLFGIKVVSKFGPLTLTSIASTEQGETQKLSISNNGQAGANNTTTIGEDRYIQDRYFFLDNVYISYYNKKYGLKGGNGQSAPQSLFITKQNLQVWKEIDQTDVKTIAQDPSRLIYKIKIDSAQQDATLMLLLRPDRDYTLSQDEGWIRFADSCPIRPDKYLGIYLRTPGPNGLIKGGNLILATNSATGKQDSIPSSLWMLKSEQETNESMTQNPDRFRLPWRNVYQIQNSAQGFVLKVFAVPIGIVDTPKVVQSGPQKGNIFTDVMGLTKNGTLVTSSKIFNFAYGELIFPPYDTSPDGNEPFANSDLGSDQGITLIDTMLYRFGSQTTPMQNYKAVFSMALSGTAKQKVFNLDIGVMENSVIVKADGVQAPERRGFFTEHRGRDPGADVAARHRRQQNRHRVPARRTLCPQPEGVPRHAGRNPTAVHQRQVVRRAEHPLAGDVDKPAHSAIRSGTVLEVPFRFQYQARFPARMDDQGGQRHTACQDQRAVDRLGRIRGGAQHHEPQHRKPGICR